MAEDCREALRRRSSACRAALARDWSAGIIQVSMMGFQAQASVGSQVGLMQSIYLVQFGAKAEVLSLYLLAALPVNLAASCFAVAVMSRVPIWRCRRWFSLGCFASLAASLALTFPPGMSEDPEVQAGAESHYFGALCLVAAAGAKFRDYPNGLARVCLLQDTESRASESAYGKIVDVMVGNAIIGALMLSMLANPTAIVRLALVAFQLASTAVSWRGARILQRLQPGADDARPAAGLTPSVLGAAAAAGGAGAGARTLAAPSDVGSLALGTVLELAWDARVWQLMTIELCAGFIFTLNSQAAGAIYWSSVVGVDDNTRSICIALESALGGGVLGCVTTLFATRLYHKRADVATVIPLVVGGGALAGGLMLALFGTTLVGAMCGIISLYLYYIVFTWSNIEFLSLLDSLRAERRGDSPMLGMFLVKDIAGGLLNNLRNLVLMRLLAATGFYEPDCNARCAQNSAPDCAAQCRAEAHASVGGATVSLVRVLYVLVTPGAYLLACLLIRVYARRRPRRHSGCDVHDC